MFWNYPFQRYKIIVTFCKRTVKLQYLFEFVSNCLKVDDIHYYFPSKYSVLTTLTKLWLPKTCNILFGFMKHQEIIYHWNKEFFLSEWNSCQKVRQQITIWSSKRIFLSLIKNHITFFYCLIRCGFIKFTFLFNQSSIMLVFS